MIGSEDILAAAWRTVPAWGVVLLGLGLAIRGLRAAWRVPREMRDPHRALRIARGLRIAILGAGVLGLGVGWLASLGWVVLLSAIIIGEEMLETSTLVAALRDAAAREGEAARVAPSEPRPGPT